MSRRRRGNRSLHFHAHQHHHQSLTIVQSPQPPSVPLVSTMQTLINAPVRINNSTTNRIFAPTVTAVVSPPSVPVVQQNPDDGLAKLITGVLGALIVGASLLANHGGSDRRRR